MTKLFEVINAKQHFTELTTFSKTPSSAYKIMRWLQSEIMPTLELIEEQRTTLIHKHGDIQADGNVLIAEESEKMNLFVTEWTEYLQADTGIQCLDLTLEELVDALSIKDDTGREINYFSEALLFTIEPFTKT